MKKILFICSHPYSGSSALYECLNHHPKIQGYRTSKNSYVYPTQLLDLTRRPHKLSNRAAIYMDELLSNEAFYVSAAYRKCHFVYVVREPEFPLNFLISGERKPPLFACREYTFRLRRLCEMAKRTPGAILLTWNNLVEKKGLSLLEDYLGVKDIEFDPVLLNLYQRDFPKLVDYKMLSKAQDAYERYLYYLKSKLSYV